MGKLGRLEGQNRCVGLGSKTFSLDGVDYSPSIKKAGYWGEGSVWGQLIGIFVGVCSVQAVTLITSLQRIPEEEFQNLVLLLKAWGGVCFGSAVRNT